MRVYEALADIDRQNQEAIAFWTPIDGATPNRTIGEFLKDREAFSRALLAVMMEMPISLAEREI